ncbi:MAG: hypothetical protein WAO35_15470 [Terriglobia bacterium]
MDHAETAEAAGVNLGDLDFLLKGKATGNVADRLGVAIGDVEGFIRGSASFAMTKRLGLTAVSAADELAQAAGTQGAIGILIGLLLAG